MTDPRDLIKAATPLPWHLDDDGTIYSDRAEVGYADVHDDALIVYAVNNLPAYLDVADALERLTTFVDESAPSDFRWAARHALSGAQEALARLRENR